MAHLTKKELQEHLDHFTQLGYEPAIPVIHEMYKLHKKDKTFIICDSYIEDAKNRIKSAMWILENFIVRELVCKTSKNKLDNFFLELPNKIRTYMKDCRTLNIRRSVLIPLSNESYQKNPIFREYFDNLQCTYFKKSTTLFILKKLECSYKHEQEIDFNKLNITIEHIMPKILTDEWKKELGDDWESIHKQYLNHIGNLTLVIRDPQLNKLSFKDKKKYYKSSPFLLNSYFSNIKKWNKNAVLKRAMDLSNRAAYEWHYSGPGFDGDGDGKGFEMMKNTKHEYIYSRPKLK
jgi:hypothetical protein